MQLLLLLDPLLAFQVCSFCFCLFFLLFYYSNVRFICSQLEGFIFIFFNDILFLGCCSTLLYMRLLLYIAEQQP